MAAAAVGLTKVYGEGNTRVVDLNRLAVPAATLVVYVIIATAAGIVAASFPARRASRLNVLDAISYE